MYMDCRCHPYIESLQTLTKQREVRNVLESTCQQRASDKGKHEVNRLNRRVGGSRLVASSTKPNKEIRAVASAK